MKDCLHGFSVRAVFMIALALSLSLQHLPVAMADEPDGQNLIRSTNSEPEEFGGLDITELANIKISLASRRSETVASTPAAVTVLTGDDILRSGANSVPEALRWAPGVNVARFNSSAWAVSIRGGNDVYANKLLVMQDGRSLYDPTFAGVYWESLSPMIEDLDRIEVVRGPGGTLWGANAVNGVINIVSKSARETQGGLVYGGGGVGDARATGGGRYGLALSEDSWMRVYAKYDLYDDSRLPDGSAGHDTMNHFQAGFRYDREVNQNTLTLQGDFYTGELKRPTGLVTPSGVLFTNKPLRTDGGNVLGRWTHEFSADSKLTVQSYFDHSWRDAIVLATTINTFDLDAQHEFKLGRRQAVTWGLGYRLSDTHITRTPVARYEPSHFDIQVFSAFAQDEITLIEDRLKLTLGCKLEHNNLTGFEVQPSGRLLWMPTERQTFWASVSRAVRTPSLLEKNIQINTYYIQNPNSPPLLVRLVGNRNIESETLTAYEAGWRMRVRTNVLVDVTGFFNDYDKITAIENEPIRVETDPPPPHLLLTTAYQNAARIHSYGGEVALTWQPTKDIRISPFYSCLHMEVVSHSPTVRPASVRVASSPKNQFGLRSSFDILRNLTLDVNLRWVDTVPTFAVPSYWEADVRAAWKIRKDLELSVAGLNLLHNSHPEFGGQGNEASLPRTEVPRAVNCKLTWRF